MDVTADMLFNRTLALMFEDASSKEDYPGFMDILNIFLAELFLQNEGLRALRGLKKMDRPPVIGKLTEVVPYEHELTGNILPYGLAGRLIGEENPSLGANYTNKYEYERDRMITRATIEPIVDVYGQAEV